ncbi:MAG TPA: hypothetical protein VFN22_09405 [Gemmatimonadales bacterium]|nr:hypothetical protein [Gemmatimonadales bacterium]
MNRATIGTGPTTFRLMRLSLPLATLLALPLPLLGQLPFLDAPVGTLRIGLHGEFAPAFREYADGTRRDLGAPISFGQDPALLRDMSTRLGTLLGRQADPGRLGSIAADLEYQRGTGTIGLAVGVTPRITIGLDLPIVSVRTQAQLTTDATGATVGVNPAISGNPSSRDFVDQFGVALTQLGERIASGAFDTDPALKMAATALAQDGPGLQAQLAALVTDPATASPVLPLTDSPDGIALRALTDDVRDELRDRFGITGFTASLALPSTALTDGDLSALLGSPAGYNLAPTTDPPLATLGDVRVGATVRVVDVPHLRIWAQAGVRLPTATAPRVRYLRDQGTGDRQFAVDLAGTIETGRGPIGVRGTATLSRPFATDREVRLGRRDEVLLPASRTTTLRRIPGQQFSLDVQPYLRVAPSFALYGQLGYLRRGATSWEAAAASTPTSGGALGSMGTGTGATAMTAGLGLSYAHSGVNKDGIVKMPVEAGFGVVRVVSSSSGLVADRLTTRVWFRVYKRLFTR